MANGNGGTALIRASRYGQVEVVRLLVEAGAHHGVTALAMASRCGQVEVVRLLLEARADMHLACRHGTAALSMASAVGYVEVVRVLLEAGAHVDLANRRGDTALIRASHHGQAEVLRLLLEAGTHIDMANNAGDTSLLLASKTGHVERTSLAAVPRWGRGGALRWAGFLRGAGALKQAVSKALRGVIPAGAPLAAFIVAGGSVGRSRCCAGRAWCLGGRRYIISAGGLAALRRLVACILGPRRGHLGRVGRDRAVVVVLTSTWPTMLVTRL